MLCQEKNSERPLRSCYVFSAVCHGKFRICQDCQYAFYLLSVSYDEKRSTFPPIWKLGSNRMSVSTRRVFSAFENLNSRDFSLSQECVDFCNELEVECLLACSDGDDECTFNCVSDTATCVYFCPCYAGCPLGCQGRVTINFVQSKLL